LPLPHPLDYDWRFDAPTIRYLVSLVLQEAHMNKRVLLLGAPSIYRALTKYDDLKQTTLIDWSRELVDYLNAHTEAHHAAAVNHDLLGGMLWEPEHPYDVVVSDPPWYPEHYRAFLAQAAYALQVGGVVLLSLLPINTRDDALSHRHEILTAAYEMGLALQRLEDSTIDYEPSPFEVHSLNSVGLHLPEGWHHGDLAVFRKFKAVDSDLLRDILDSVPHHEHGWHELLIDNRKLKLRGPLDDDSPLLIRRIEPNDVLPTVGRGYERRADVDLWLWDNRVYAVTGKAVLWAALHQLVDKPMPSDVAHVDAARVSEAVAELRRLNLL